MMKFVRNMVRFRFKVILTFCISYITKQVMLFYKSLTMVLLVYKIKDWGAPQLTGGWIGLWIDGFGPKNRVDHRFYLKIWQICGSCNSTADCGFKQKFWHGLWILNYFAFGIKDCWFWKIISWITIWLEIIADQLILA